MIVSRNRGGRGMRREIEEYFRENMGIYIVIIALFVGGVLAGALALRGLGEQQLLELNRYFDLFVDGFPESPAGPGGLFRQALNLNFRYLLLIWFLGLFLYGFPFVAGLVGLRGFSLGFTVGFLVRRNALRGALFATGAVLPHNLILIPTLIIGGMTAFSFSWLRLRSSLEQRPCSLREYIGPYSLMFLLVALFTGTAVFVEAYISPVFVKLLIPTIRL